MAPDERERMAILCERIAKEQDYDKYKNCVGELNQILKRKEARLASTKLKAK